MMLAYRNNWHAEQMGLGDLMEPLFDFITQTWQPRGTESAKLWYDVRGWVAFTNLNIFGHTGYTSFLCVMSSYP